MLSPILALPGHAIDIFNTLVLFPLQNINLIQRCQIPMKNDALTGIWAYWYGGLYLEICISLMNNLNLECH